MSFRTLNDLSRAVMEKLAVLDAAESPAATDHALIVARYTELMEGLRDEALSYWDDASIPLLVFPAVTDLVALHCASAFGKPTDVSMIEAAEVPIKRRIRKHTHKRSVGFDDVVNF